LENFEQFLQNPTGLGAMARVSGGRAESRAAKTAGKLAGQPQRLLV